jgi:hypothetical protein
MVTLLKNLKKFIKERATSSIYEGDLDKNPSNETDHTNCDISLANPSIHNNGFLNKAHD